MARMTIEEAIEVMDDTVDWRIQRVAWGRIRAKLVELLQTPTNNASTPCRWYKNGCETCTCNPPAQAHVA